MKWFSECEAEIEVSSGGTLTVESGSFRFNLGSGQKGIYHEIRAVGMEDVTSEFAEYDLAETGKEKNLFPHQLIRKMIIFFPKTVGGSKVHLLLGARILGSNPIYSGFYLQVLVFI